MSNPNVNISNLDARYSKPADVNVAVSAQAATDAGQYAHITQLLFDAITVLPDSQRIASSKK